MDKVFIRGLEVLTTIGVYEWEKGIRQKLCFDLEMGFDNRPAAATDDSVDHPVSLYAATKKANELMAHTYSHLYGIPTTGLRFFTVYGPWGRPDMAPMLFADAILNDRAIKVFNHGNMSRDFTYVDDIVDGVIKVVDNPANSSQEFNPENPNPSISIAPYRIYNIGNNAPVQLLDFIETLEIKIGIKAKKDFMDMQDGDIISVDCGALKNGFYGDHAYTFEVGEVAEATKKLLKITKESLYEGIRATKVGNRVEDIGNAIQLYCEAHGYGVVRELCGHGLGRKMHEDPEVPNYGKRGRGKQLVNGMVIAIEPMINQGTKNIKQHKDGWTITTADGKPSAHFEHDVAIVNGKPELLSTFAYIYEALGIVSNEEDGLRQIPFVL